MDTNNRVNLSLTQEEFVKLFEILMDHPTCNGSTPMRLLNDHEAIIGDLVKKFEKVYFRLGDFSDNYENFKRTTKREISRLRNEIRRSNKIIFRKLDEMNRQIRHFQNGRVINSASLTAVVPSIPSPPAWNPVYENENYCSNSYASCDPVCSEWMDMSNNVNEGQSNGEDANENNVCGDNTQAISLADVIAAMDAKEEASASENGN